MNFFKKLFAKKSFENPELKQNFEEIYSDLGIFEYFEDGFKITTKDFEKTLKWFEIDQINAFKKDLYAYDLVVLEILCGENALSINEETPGWFQFIIKLKDVFETIPKDWEINITQPAFAENYTVLYEKK